MLFALSWLGLGILLGALFLVGQLRGRSFWGIPFLTDRARHPRLFWTGQTVMAILILSWVFFSARISILASQLAGEKFKMRRYLNLGCIDPGLAFRVNTRPMNLNRAFSSRRRASFSGARRPRARI